MATVTVRKGDAQFEIRDLTFDQVKELIGVNGYSRPSAGESKPAAGVSLASLPPHRDMDGFLKNTSDRGRAFVRALLHHPDGIEANALAAKMGFQDARQIGGLSGGGLVKTAKKHGIKLEHLYRREITMGADGKRTVIFFPGRLITAMSAIEKPAV
jgi:hypothetical protein